MNYLIILNTLICKKNMRITSYKTLTQNLKIIVKMELQSYTHSSEIACLGVDNYLEKWGLLAAVLTKEKRGE